MLVEKASVSDAEDILALQKQAYLSEAAIYGDFQIKPLVQTLRELRTEFETSHFYVLRDRSELIGSVNLRIRGGTGIVGRLMVRPDRQGEGFGARLMDFLESEHSNLLALELFTGHKSERNLRFYARRGYVEFRREVVHPRLSFVYLRKDLPARTDKG